MFVTLRYEAQMSEDWMTRRNREDLAVKTAIESFPDTFLLYGMADTKFRIAQPPTSFYSDHTGVQLVVQIQNTRGEWQGYARCEPHVIRERMRLK